MYYNQAIRIAFSGKSTLFLDRGQRRVFSSSHKTVPGKESWCQLFSALGDQGDHSKFWGFKLCQIQGETVILGPHLVGHPILFYKDKPKIHKDKVPAKVTVPVYTELQNPSGVSSTLLRSNSLQAITSLEVITPNFATIRNFVIDSSHPQDNDY